MKASANSIRSGVMTDTAKPVTNLHSSVIFLLPLGGLRCCYADCIAVPCQLLNISPTAHKYTRKHKITCTNTKRHLCRLIRKPTPMLCWQTTPRRSRTNTAVDSHQIISYARYQSTTDLSDPDDLDLLCPEDSVAAGVLKYSHNYESFP